MPRIRQSVAAGVPKHVAVNREGEAGTLANTLDQPIDRVWCERAAPLGREDEATIRELPAQVPECPDLIAPQRMDAWLAVLDAADMQGSRSAELHLRPFQVAYFGSPQPVPEGDQDQGGVPVAVAAVLGRPS
jgi:hypothetical protein